MIVVARISKTFAIMGIAVLAVVDYHRLIKCQSFLFRSL